MKTGSIGDIVFEASSDRAMTYGGYGDSMTARIGTHEVAGIEPVSEFIGAGMRNIDIDVTLMRSLGVDVEAEISKAQRYCTDGELLVLQLGGTVIGGAGARWLIETVDVSRKSFAVDGSVLNADMALGLRLAQTSRTPANAPTVIVKKNITKGEI